MAPPGCLPQRGWVNSQRGRGWPWPRTVRVQPGSGLPRLPSSKDRWSGVLARARRRESLGPLRRYQPDQSEFPAPACASAGRTRCPIVRAKTTTPPTWVRSARSELRRPPIWMPIRVRHASTWVGYVRSAPPSEPRAPAPPAPAPTSASAAPPRRRGSVTPTNHTRREHQEQPGRATSTAPRAPPGAARATLVPHPRTRSPIPAISLNPLALRRSARSSGAIRPIAPPSRPHPSS
jgi:hypothetical protein